MFVILLILAALLFLAGRILDALHHARSAITFRVLNPDQYVKRFNDSTDSLIKDRVIELSSSPTPYLKWSKISIIASLLFAVSSIIFALSSCTSTRTISHSYNFQVDTTKYHFEYVNKEDYQTSKSK